MTPEILRSEVFVKVIRYSKYVVVYRHDPGAEWQLYWEHMSDTPEDAMRAAKEDIPSLRFAGNDTRVVRIDFEDQVNPFEEPVPPVDELEP